MSIIRCGFSGALIAGVFSAAALILYNVYCPKDTNEGKAWGEFVLLMLGFNSLFVGFIFGSTYGAISSMRKRRQRRAAEAENARKSATQS
jgi:hypothetical protein